MSSNTTLPPGPRGVYSPLGASRGEVLGSLAMLELEEASVYARRLQALQGLRLAAEAEYAEAFPVEPGRRLVIPESVYADVVAEVCAVRNVGRRQVEAELAEASTAMENLPVMFEQMMDGFISRRHARAVTDEAAPLIGAKAAAEAAYERARAAGRPAGEVARLGRAAMEASARLVEYEEQALELVEGRTAASLRGRCQRLAARLLGATAEERKRAARAKRGVWLRDLSEGMCELTAVLPVDIGTAIYDRLTQQASAIARANADANKTDANANAGADTDAGTGAESAGAAGRAGAEGANADADAGAEAARTSANADATAINVGAAAADGRTFEQIRADVLADLLLASEPSEVHAAGRGIDATVAITVPALTVLGADSEPATLNGSVPIALDDARRYAAGAPSWLRILTDPVTGVAREVDTYRPTAAQRALIGARDITCRFPGCRRPARRCDIDHATAWANGGPTALRNLESLCQWHHTLKHTTAWTVRHDPEQPGCLVWTAPSGREYTDHAPPIGPVFTPTDRTRLAGGRSPGEPPGEPPEDEPPPF